MLPISNDNRISPAASAANAAGAAQVALSAAAARLFSEAPLASAALAMLDLLPRDLPALRDNANVVVAQLTQAMKDRTPSRGLGRVGNALQK